MVLAVVSRIEKSVTKSCIQPSATKLSTSPTQVLHSAIIYHLLSSFFLVARPTYPAIIPLKHFISSPTITGRPLIQSIKDPNMSKHEAMAPRADAPKQQLIIYHLLSFSQAVPKVNLSQTTHRRDVFVSSISLFAMGATGHERFAVFVQYKH